MYQDTDQHTCSGYHGVYICVCGIATRVVTMVFTYVWYSYQDTDQHDEAVRDLEFVLRKEPSAENRAAVKDAKRLEKLAKRKNYYKILNISRGATEVEIKRAYKKSALLHHPDRHATADDATRGEEEGIFKDVSEAYSVLSDPRKKARYDSGQDLDEVTMGKCDLKYWWEGWCKKTGYMSGHY